MRKKLIAGNWKSNLLRAEAENLAKTIAQSVFNSHCNIALFPSEAYLSNIISLCEGKAFVGAQNCSMFAEGAFTGESSAKQLQSVGVQMILAGHSERRQLFGETNEVVKAKINQIIEAGLTAVFCCGETLAIRQANNQNKLVQQQLNESLFHLNVTDFSRVIIAYEPVWAIGTGVVATPNEAEEMHAFIRNCVAEKYGKSIAEKSIILYGGSVKPDNATSLLSCENIDGALVGGASLKANDFLAIANAVK